jgi:hypothetical protein
VDLFVVSINAIVVVAVGGVVAWLGRGRFEAIDRRFDRLETRLDGRIDGLGTRQDGLETRLDGRFSSLETRLEGQIDELGARLDHRIDSLERRMDGFQSSVDAMRSDLTQVALAVGVRPRAQNG